jgi:integrase
VDPYKLRDGGGLVLVVMPHVGKWWQLNYRRPDTGKRNTLSLGTYPAVSLKRTREKREEARKLLADGIDPGAQRQASKEAARQAIVEAEQEVEAVKVAIEQEAARSFRVVAADWLESKRPIWTVGTYEKAMTIFRSCLLPELGHLDMATLLRADLLPVLRGLPPSYRHKAKSYLVGMVEFAIDARLRDESKPLAFARGALGSRKRKNMPAAIDPAALRDVLQVVDNYPIPVTRAALTLLLLTGQRPGNVVAAEWSEIDFDAREWSISSEKMKMKRAHVVPLSRQAVDVLREMQAITCGRQFVFPPLARQTNTHLNRDTLSKALRESGLQGKHVPHGSRATLRTVARERLNEARDVLEAQLAHVKRSDVEAAYDRAQFVDERHLVAQRWADYLDVLHTGSNVIPLQRKAA